MHARPCQANLPFPYSDLVISITNVWFGGLPTGRDCNLSDTALAKRKKLLHTLLELLEYHLSKK